MSSMLLATGSPGNLKFTTKSLDLRILKKKKVCHIIIALLDGEEEAGGIQHLYVI